MTAREVEMLGQLAQADGVGVSEFLRGQVRRLYENAGLKPAIKLSRRRSSP